MEAKDTVINTNSGKDGDGVDTALGFHFPYHRAFDITRSHLALLLEYQAEISFKAGMEEEKKGGTNSLSYLEGLEEGEKLGIKEVVEPSDELLETGRKAIEDVLIEWRDGRLSEFTRGNGLVIREKDGKDSSIIRFGPETALRIGLKAMGQAKLKKWGL